MCRCVGVGVGVCIGVWVCVCRCVWVGAPPRSGVMHDLAILFNIKFRSAAEVPQTAAMAG